MTDRPTRTITETAEALSVSRSTIYMLFDRGELGWVQVGSRRLVPTVEIERFLDEHFTRAAL